MKSFFTNFKKQTFTSHHVKIVNPHKQWMMLLRIFGVIGVVLFAFSIYLLFQIKNDQVFQVSHSTPSKSLSVNEKSLKKVTEIFEAKKIRFDEIKNSSSRYQDPGL